jgi:hypothetical protein
MGRKRDIDYATSHPIHDAIFGNDPYGLTDDPAHDRPDDHLFHGTSVQPEAFQPMLGTGQTDQHHRQPDGGRQR